MKEQHVGSRRVDAIETLKLCGVAKNADFHTLSSSQVDALVEEAKRRKYRKPKYANGSTARYFHDMLQRRAHW